MKSKLIASCIASILFVLICSILVIGSLKIKRLQRELSNSHEEQKRLETSLAKAVETAKTANDILFEYEENRKKIEREALLAQQARIAAQRQQLEFEKQSKLQRLAELKAAYEAEQLRTLNIIVGNFDPTQLAEFKRISSKRKDGEELTLKEEWFLRKRFSTVDEIGDFLEALTIARGEPTAAEIIGGISGIKPDRRIARQFIWRFNLLERAQLKRLVSKKRRGEDFTRGDELLLQARLGGEPSVSKLLRDRAAARGAKATTK